MRGQIRHGSQIGPQPAATEGRDPGSGCHLEPGRYRSIGANRYLIRAFNAPKPSRQVIFLPSSASRPA